MRKLFSILIVAAVVLLAGCKKTTEQYPSAPLSDYFPLIVGKYITYSLDSTVYYKNFGASASVNSYQVKYVVDAAITDNLGRPAFRILRYIRSTPTAAWAPENTFMAVNTGNSIEYIENNLRFVKLVEPIQQDYTWKGNSFINTNSQTPYLKYYDDWNYTYDSLNMPAKIGALTVDSTIKVAEMDDRTAIDRTFSEAKYAKGIGLVYRNFLYWNTGNANGTFSDASYGVVLKMIDHN